MNMEKLKAICVAVAVPVILVIAIATLMNISVTWTFDDGQVNPTLFFIVAGICAIAIAIGIYLSWKKSVIVRATCIGALIVTSPFILCVLIHVLEMLLDLFVVFAQIVLLICAGCLVFLRYEKREAIKRLHLGWRIIIDAITVSAIFISLINLLYLFWFIMYIISPPYCYHDLVLPPVTGTMESVLEVEDTE